MAIPFIDQKANVLGKLNPGANLHDQLTPQELFDAYNGIGGGPGSSDLKLLLMRMAASFPAAQVMAVWGENVQYRTDVLFEGGAVEPDRKALYDFDTSIITGSAVAHARIQGQLRALNRASGRSHDYVPNGNGHHTRVLRSIMDPRNTALAVAVAGGGPIWTRAVAGPNVLGAGGQGLVGAAAAPVYVDRVSSSHLIITGTSTYPDPLDYPKSGGPDPIVCANVNIGNLIQETLATPYKNFGDSYGLAVSYANKKIHRMPPSPIYINQVLSSFSAYVKPSTTNPRTSINAYFMPDKSVAVVKYISLAEADFAAARAAWGTYLKVPRCGHEVHAITHGLVKTLWDHTGFQHVVIMNHVLAGWEQRVPLTIFVYPLTVQGNLALRTAPCWVQPRVPFNLIPVAPPNQPVNQPVNHNLAVPVNPNAAVSVNPNVAAPAFNASNGAPAHGNITAPINSPNGLPTMAPQTALANQQSSTPLNIKDESGE